jgi:hypothetical protein
MKKGTHRNTIANIFEAINKGKHISCNPASNDSTVLEKKNFQGIDSRVT